MLNKGNHQKSLSCPFRYDWFPLERLWLSLSWLAQVFYPDVKSWSMFSCIWSWDLIMTVLMFILLGCFSYSIYSSKMNDHRKRNYSHSLLPSVMFTICVFIGVCVCVHVFVYSTLTAYRQLNRWDKVNCAEPLLGSLAVFCVFHVVQLAWELVFAAWIAEPLLQGSLACLGVTQ